LKISVSSETPPIILSSVDFPEPDGPAIERNSPVLREKLMPFNASTSVFPSG
jgi:hypothetical protein